MRRLMSFLTGMVAGALVLYFAMHYHLIRSKEGVHLVAKTSPRLAATYVDIRNFRVADWTNHADLAAAVLAADRRDLMESAAGDALQGGLEHWLGPPAN